MTRRKSIGLVCTFLLCFTLTACQWATSGFSAFVLNDCEIELLTSAFPDMDSSRLTAEQFDALTALRGCSNYLMQKYYLDDFGIESFQVIEDVYLVGYSTTEGKGFCVVVKTADGYVYQEVKQ